MEFYLLFLIFLYRHYIIVCIHLQKHFANGCYTGKIMKDLAKNLLVFTAKAVIVYGVATVATIATVHFLNKQEEKRLAEEAKA